MQNYIKLNPSRSPDARPNRQSPSDGLMANDELNKVELPALEQLSLWDGHMLRANNSLLINLMNEVHGRMWF